VDAAERLALARWTKRRRRTPFMLMAMAGALVAPYLTLVGHGWRAAERALPQSLAALAAREPAALPPERNAWTWWHAAADALPHPKLGNPQVPELSVAAMRDPRTWADGSAVRAFCATSERLLDQAEAAAAIPEVAFGLDYRNPFGARSGHLTELRAVGRALRIHALAAAHDGDWSRCARCVGAIAAIPVVLGREPDLLGFLVATGTRTLEARTLREAALTGAASADGLAQLQALARRDADRALALAPAFEADRARFLPLFDELGCGRLEAVREPSGPTRVPRALSWYSAVYPFDRQAYTTTMDAAILAARHEAPLSPVPDFTRSSLYGLAPRAYVGSNLALPAIGMISARQVGRAEYRLTDIAIAARRYQLAQGAWPTSLDDLRLEPLRLVDPCARPSARFIWRVVDGVTEIRSRGRNGRDDSDRESATFATDDIVVKLFPDDDPR
jgi:hypothetical protein